MDFFMGAKQVREGGGAS